MSVSNSVTQREFAEVLRNDNELATTRADE